jgi:hypothetical protein
VIKMKKKNKEELPRRRQYTWAACRKSARDRDQLVILILVSVGSRLARVILSIPVGFHSFSVGHTETLNLLFFKIARNSSCARDIQLGRGWRIFLQDFYGRCHVKDFGKKRWERKKFWKMYYRKNSIWPFIITSFQVL